jgi:putative ABC transport system ATP-binding protein
MSDFDGDRLLEKRTPLYSGRDISFTYDTKSPGPLVLNHINFEIEPGDMVCLAGPSGSGKSTLLNLMGLIERPQLGSLLFKGADLKTLKDRDLDRLRRFEIGFVFQDFQLIEVLNVEENVSYFLHRQRLSSAEIKRRVDQYLEALGIENFRKQRVHTLSGGQKQRVSIARAMAKEPSVIIADEPTASLDQTNGRHVVENLQKLCQHFDCTVVVASHDPMVLQYAHRIIYLRDGEIVEKIGEAHLAG